MPAKQMKQAHSCAGTLLHALKRLALAIVLAGSGIAAHAQTPDNAVRIHADGKNGGGYTIQNGRICYVVTAKHVVEDDWEVEEGEEKGIKPQILVTDSRGVTSTAQRVRPSPSYDLALYRLSGDEKLVCGQNWQDGSAAMSAAEDPDANLFLQRRQDSGSGRRAYLLFDGNDGDSKFLLLPRSRDADGMPRQGDSGSPIFAGRALIGVAVNVDTQSGRVTAISQKTIDAEFASEVVSATKVRVLIDQVTQNRRSEFRTGTLSLLDSLEARENFIVFERPPIYIGTDSWAGNVAPQLAARRGLPSIPSADFLLKVDIVSINSKSARVPKYAPGGIQTGVGATPDIGGLLGDVIGGDIGRELKKQNTQRANKLKEMKTVYDVTGDLEIRLIDTSTREMFRHRQRISQRFDTTDYRQAQLDAIESAIDSGVGSILDKAGL